jgi:hypothetical protein
MADSLVRHLLRLPFRRTLRCIAIVAILFGPIASAAWAIGEPGSVLWSYVEVDSGTANGPAADSVREYLAGRDPVLDRLLPSGAGGTRFFKDLDGNAGMAFPLTSAVGLAAGVDSGGWPEAIELHERAHLLYASLPEEASRLIARVPPPVPDEYAGKNASEHLAEMAATAWQVVTPSDRACMDGTPSERLLDAERRVPGTAAFVSWYVRVLRQEDVDGHEEIARTAPALAAPYRHESDAIWKAVEDRRLPGGHFRPWENPTVRGHLEGRRAQARVSSHWLDRIEGYLLMPSLLILSIARQ